MQQPITRLYFRLETVEAIQNPELMGKAEWVFRVTVNEIERWRTEQHVSVGAGQTVPAQGEFSVRLLPEEKVVTIEVAGMEKDFLNPDDHAFGKTVLYRSMDFGSEGGFDVELSGKDAQLTLHFGVRTEEEPAGASEA